MGGASYVHWLFMLLLLAPMFPIGAILKKAGYSPWLALIYLAPILNIVFLFVFAYSKWPMERQPDAAVEI